MALIRSLNTAVAGIQAQQFRIEMIGNNIANVDTTAFKAGRVDFATMLSQMISHGVAPQGNLGGIDPTQIGHGVSVGNTSADWGQGPTEATGVASDLAIQGGGMFVLQDQAGGRLFTRDGSFTINPSNLLHDPASGFVVQGWMADDNFEINTGGSLTNIEIPLGLETIARATNIVTLSGNLRANGLVGREGTQLFSERLYDDRFTNSDLISSENPLGLARATADTPLQNLVRSNGDQVDYDATTGEVGTAGTSSFVFPELQDQPTGVEIDLMAQKGSRSLPGSTFIVGDPPPTGGTSLGDLMGFFERTFGINTGTWNGVEQTENMLSFQRRDPQTGEVHNGTIELNAGGTPDIATLSSITDHDADFRGVQVGDFIRFDSGAAAGQIAEIVGVSASTPGGPLDTLTFRTDGFNSLEVTPAYGDTYAIHASTGVTLAQDASLATIDGGSPTVTIGAPATNGSLRSFTITDSAVTNFISERGIGLNQEVRFLSGGAVVSGFITSLDPAGNAFTVSFDASLAQDPDAGSTFEVLQQAQGSVQVAGNVGVSNDIHGLSMISGGQAISFFNGTPVRSAEGESIRMTTTIYDSLGTPRQIDLTLVKEGTTSNGPSVWRYFAESRDDADLDRVVGSGTILFGADGQVLGTGRPDEMLTIDLQTTAAQAEGVETPLQVELDLSRLTQFSVVGAELEARQDGFGGGTLSDYAIGADGVIQGIFSTGEVRQIGQIALARFANPNGLTDEGGNFYSAAPNSGEAQIGAAGSFGRGTLMSGFLEESNVDLAQQFTDLVIGQRAFQANARTVSVSDEMLQELVNLI